MGVITSALARDLAVAGGWYRAVTMWWLSWGNREDDPWGVRRHTGYYLENWNMILQLGLCDFLGRLCSHKGILIPVLFENAVDQYGPLALSKNGHQGCRSSTRGKVPPRRVRSRPPGVGTAPGTKPRPALKALDGNERAEQVV